ncbi:hypothetical protein ABZ907_38320 [Nonomuraea wenchangensis]
MRTLGADEPSVGTSRSVLDAGITSTDTTDRYEIEQAPALLALLDGERTGSTY